MKKSVKNIKNKSSKKRNFRKTNNKRNRRNKKYGAWGPFDFAKPKSQWLKQYDPNTKQFYYANTTTKQSQWEKPQDFNDGLPDEWGEFIDTNTNKKYYANPSTGEYKWTKPNQTSMVTSIKNVGDSIIASMQGMTKDELRNKRIENKQWQSNSTNNNIKEMCIASSGDPSSWRIYYISMLRCIALKDDELLNLLFYNQEPGFHREISNLNKDEINSRINEFKNELSGNFGLETLKDILSKLTFSKLKRYDAYKSFKDAYKRIMDIYINKYNISTSDFNLIFK